MTTKTDEIKKTFTQEDVKAIRAALKKLKPATPARAKAEHDLRAKDVIMQLAPDLLKMRDKGIATADMLGVLRQRGVLVKAGTLTRYLNLYQKEHEGKTPPAPAPDAVPESEKVVPAQLAGSPK